MVFSVKQDPTKDFLKVGSHLKFYAKSKLGLAGSQVQSRLGYGFPVGNYLKFEAGSQEGLVELQVSSLLGCAFSGGMLLGIQGGIPCGIPCGMFHNPGWDPTWDTPGIPGGIGRIPPYIFTFTIFIHPE